MNLESFAIDGYALEIYSIDKRGKRTRWGDKAITLYSDGITVGTAVFAAEGEEPPEPYYKEGKIFYFASNTQYQAVLDLLRNEKSVYLAWRPVNDPKEHRDGDAVFYTEKSIVK